MSARETNVQARARGGPVRLIPVNGENSFFIRFADRHAGGITVHSVCGDAFSYGIAVTPALRRRGVASAALPLLFETMRLRGFERVIVRVAQENAASLSLHRKLGFVQTACEDGIVTLERAL